jgi:hypothetical protein
MMDAMTASAILGATSGAPRPLTVMITASWPTTALATSAWLRPSPTTTLARPPTSASADACRANAVTSWPRRTASSRMSRPLPPVDPNTVIFTSHLN